MTGKNFYTFNILIEFESICDIPQVLVATREFRLCRVTPRFAGALSATKRCLRKIGEVGSAGSDKRIADGHLFGAIVNA
jgi:hypothetical protein